jgi:hypothetical protein
MTRRCIIVLDMFTKCAIYKPMSRASSHALKRPPVPVPSEPGGGGPGPPPPRPPPHHWFLRHVRPPSRTGPRGLLLARRRGKQHGERKLHDRPGDVNRAQVSRSGRPCPSLRPGAAIRGWKGRAFTTARRPLDNSTPTTSERYPERRYPAGRRATRREEPHHAAGALSQRAQRGSNASSPCHAEFPGVDLRRGARSIPRRWHDRLLSQFSSHSPPFTTVHPRPLI